MASIMDSVNQRTQLVGQNRLELLLFRLNGRQRFGINVFKVREVLQCPPLTVMPKLNSCIRGVAHIRGQTISVIDLSMAVGKRPIEDLSKCFIIISEYNRSVQGFLVHSVERIINMNWESILPPPKGAGRINYMTAVTEVDGELVEILDVERILNEISPVSTEVSAELVDASVEHNTHGRPVLVADDSSVARKQVQRALEAIGVQCVLAKDGREALNMLLEMAKNGPIKDQIALVISDIEMPEMDGYTFTAEIRNNPNLKDLHVILHTSLSGVFNQAMVQKVGANNFIAKFQPDELAKAVQGAL
ncbi:MULTISPECIES: chemotaxis protein CheV [Aeromonas]|jgi:two-component system chemotaxis response regulator CheV|uniref:Chemotaxis signal transduction protein CheV n=6 Tax=Bacteria TaxID=2 RepID=A0A3L0VY43_ECOLX|nr:MULTISPECIES: chemotaxis protein CheV [Aeromonas]ELI6432143.1 chemotaxis protein CheV [Aeromonas salmonicida subsp. salmonicida]MBP6450986.1 chemotaxis protein CheV [Aeromonas sp.]ARW81448.1 Chemotaxis protein CheV [Aeromonas salmonicida]ATP10322.1 CheW domain protein / response regulator [Aeromonas salmonicida subsp. pectinolytica 34mel]ATU98443.1 chemotaxis protein CheV [Aeromonas salmonicida]